MKIHGNSNLITVKKLIKQTLGIDVDILDGKTKKPGSDKASFASLCQRGHSPKAADFKPDGKMLIHNLEQAFQDHYGVGIRILTPDGEPTNVDDTYGQLRRRYAQASGARPPLAEWIEAAMKRKGWRAEELAAQAGISTLTVSNIQFGNTQNPQSTTLKNLEGALGEKVPEEVKAEVKEDAETGFGELVDFDPWGEDGNAPIPTVPGVYVLYDITERPIYVGKSEKSIRTRIEAHAQKKWFTPPFVAKAAYVQISDTGMIARIEKLLIRFLKSSALVNQQFVARDSNASLPQPKNSLDTSASPRRK